MIPYQYIDQPLSPFSFMAILSRRFVLILVLFVVIIASVMGAAFLLPPVYKSTAKVMVNYEDEWQKLVNLGVSKSNYDLIGTEMTIIATRSIIEPIVAELKPESFVDNADGLLNAEQLQRLAVEQILNALEIEREKETNVVSISYEGKNAQLAANVVNGIIQQYIAQRPRFSRDDKALEYFDKQISDIRGRLDNLESNSLLYKETENVLSPARQSDILVSNLADYDRELTRVRTDRITKESRLNVLRERLRSGNEVVVAAMESSNSLSKMEHLNQLRERLTQLESRQNGLKLKYTDKHPDMIALNSDIKAARESISREVQILIEGEETDVRMLVLQENQLAQRMNNLAAQITDFSRKEYELGKRTIGIEDLRVVLSMLLRQREEAQLAANKKEYLVQARILEDAEVPRKPAKPNKKLYAAVALVLGSFFSVGIALFIEYFDHSIYTVEDAMGSTGLNILAVISEADPRQLSNRDQAPRRLMTEKDQVHS
ncbi:MAG: hypothetical protein EHM72_15580 [Calditrichaeota bacterium]|nr:MAG: hypothetical protein EHM72_15580 [Calditrichota bacterium]